VFTVAVAVPLFVVPLRVTVDQFMKEQKGE